MSIRCAMFDFGNVIGHYDTAKFYEVLGSYSHCDIHPREVLLGVWRGKFIEMELGLIDHRQYFWYLKDLLCLDDSFKLADFEDLFSDVISIDPAMLKILDDLRASGLYLMLITNNNEFHMNWLEKNHPDLLNRFDYKMISSRRRMRKPHPDMWRIPIRSFRLLLDHALFVDDSLENVDQFRHLGGSVGYHYNITDDQGRVVREKYLRETEYFIAFLERAGLIAKSEV